MGERARSSAQRGLAVPPDRKAAALPALLLVVCSACASSRVDVITTFNPPEFFVEHDRMEEHGIQTVAVAGLKELGTPLPQAWELVSDELNLQLGQATEFQLVERLRIDALLRELRLAPRIVDEAKAREIGRMLGADAVILGTFRADPQEWSLSARLVQVESGLQDWRSRAYATSSEQGTWVLAPQEMIRELCSSVASSLSPLPRREPWTRMGSRPLTAQERHERNATEALSAVMIAFLPFIIGVIALL